MDTSRGKANDIGELTNNTTVVQQIPDMITQTSLDEVMQKDIHTTMTMVITRLMLQPRHTIMPTVITETTQIILSPPLNVMIMGIRMTKGMTKDQDKRPVNIVDMPDILCTLTTGTEGMVDITTTCSTLEVV